MFLFFNGTIAKRSRNRKRNRISEAYGGFDIVGVNCGKSPVGVTQLNFSLHEP